MADAADLRLVMVADELYGLPASMFIAGRTAHAKAARGAGDRDLAARIETLPKPSVSAGLVNRLVRDGGKDLQRLLDLGAALRQAQEQADPERLRELGAQRRALLAEVTATIADREERRPGAAVLEEVQQTLQAALADDAAAVAVRSGRLVRALKADGLDPVDTAGAVAAPDLPAAAHPPAPRSPATSRAAAAPPGAAEESERTQREAERREAERLAAEAADRARAAHEEADAAAARARDATALLRTRADEAQRLRAELEELQGRLSTAEQDVAAAEEDARAAAAEQADAARAADAAGEEARALRP